MGILWHNGNIYTMIQEGDRVEAVFTENGKITAIGSKQELQQAFKKRITEEKDLQRGTMIPGLVDSHMHLIGYGEKLLRLDLSHMKSKKQVLAAVAYRVSKTEGNEWIIGEGWNENLWEEADIIVRSELDRIAPNHPVLLKRTCRHALVVNSKALAMAKIDESVVEPEGGIIERDGANLLNGLFKDKAQNLMIDALPPVSKEYLERALREAVKSCWSFGLVGVHTEDMSYYGSFDQTYGAFCQVIETGDYPFKAHLLVHHEVIDEWKKEGHSFLSGGEYLEWGAMKIFADGALGGRTALLSHPYQDDPSTNGVAIHSSEALAQLVKKARNLDLPIAVHVIGDLAFQLSLEAVKKHPTNSLRRDRFIHGQILRKELIEEAKELPMIIDIQPQFVSSDFPWVVNRVGEENMSYNYAWKTLLEEGITLAGGSDAPIEDSNPLLGIHAAISRSVDVEGKSVIFQQDEQLSRYEAISLYTKGSAYASHHEKDRGMISVGYSADFTVFEKNPFCIPLDDIPGLACRMTVINEQVVYKK
ncbi:amidohydrolase [Bacillus sp. 2205SS5-2]|uniref:amidohydrolase n=1 Tax=Bacillus sp. 2205SS5-2 TaxID=3109031 RepID=UPI0030046EC4